MNSFYKILPALAMLLSVLSFTSIYSEWSSGPHVIFTSFTHETGKDDAIADKSHSDFSHDNRRSDFGNHGLSTFENNFEKYTPQDFQHHYAQSGYTQAEILHQRCLYMHDAFVKYVQ